VGALFFDSQLRLLGFRLLSMGGQTMTVADPREVVISALEMRATAVILVHNHPSGVPSPSGPDDTTTTRLKEILRLLGMTLADHIILGKSGDTYSYAMSARLNPRRKNPRRSNPDTTGRTPPKGLVVYHYYEGDDDPQMDRWAKKAWDIALASPIRIMNNRELTAIAVLGKKVVGGGWSATSYPPYDEGEAEFTFDIVVAPEAQRKGVGDALVEEMLKQFRDVDGTLDMDFVLNIEVVNPAMERILARRGFTRRGEDDPRASHGDVMMTRRNGRRRGKQ
jgi:GNAT superfamily N-acetyltransferase